MGTWVASLSWHLHLMLLGSLGSMYLFPIRVFAFSRCIPVRGLAGSHGNSTLSFSRNLHTVLRSGCTGVHSPQQSLRAPFSPLPCQHLRLVFPCDDGHPARCEVAAHGALICFSLTTGNTLCHFQSHLHRLLHLLFGKMCIQFFLLLNQVGFFVFWFFIFVESYELFIYFGYYPLICCINTHIFVPCSRLSFLFCQWFPLLCKAFKFN